MVWVVTWCGRARVTRWVLDLSSTPGSRAAPFDLALLVIMTMWRLCRVVRTLVWRLSTGRLGHLSWTRVRLSGVSIGLFQVCL